MLLKNVRLSFPDLFIAKAFNDAAEAKYKAMFIMPKDHPQLAEVKEAMKACKAKKWPRNEDVRPILCLRDGEEKSGAGFGKDVVFFNASSTIRPTVINADTSPLTAADGKPYAGCYVDVNVEFWAMDNQYGKRINAALRGVQFRADGEAFGGGSGPASVDDFEVIEEVGEAQAVASAEDLDDMLA